MNAWEGPGFVDAHTHLLQVAAGAIRLGSDPYTARPIHHDPESVEVTAAIHRRIAGQGSTPMDQPPLPLRAFDLPGALDAGLRSARELGLVQVTEAGVTDWAYVDGLAEARARAELPVRVRLLIASGLAERHTLTRFGDPWLEIEGVKFYADGWLCPRTCAMSEPFRDRPDDTGLLFMDAATLARRAAPFAEAGWTVATHAIGDRAVETVLDAYQAVWGADCRAAAPRIEHAQVMRRDLVDRMAAMGVVACIQPSFAVADAADADACLGPRHALAYRWGAFLDAGVTVISGSDFPVETLSPLWGLRRLVTGADTDGGVVAPTLDLDLALRIMTDETAGTTTLSEDPRAVAPELIHQLAVLDTAPAGAPLASASDRDKKGPT